MLLAASLSMFGCVPPALTALDPGIDAIYGGDEVVLIGSGFGDDTSVQFGDVDAESVAVVSDTRLIAVAPPSGAAGAVDVTVTTAFGAATLEDGYAYDAPRVFGSTEDSVQVSEYADDGAAGPIRVTRGPSAGAHEPAGLTVANGEIFLANFDSDNTLDSGYGAFVRLAR